MQFIFWDNYLFKKKFVFRTIYLFYSVINTKAMTLLFCYF